MITTTHQEINLCNFKDECHNKTANIVLVADWHVGPYKQYKYVERVVEEINLALPDLVLMPDIAMERVLMHV